MDRSEILGQYTIVRDPDQLAAAYRPLVQAVGADYVAVQVASVDPERTIGLIGSEVLPELRDLAADVSRR
jgi:coenzyme F420-dependent glucose-6-phosphate dehydrogenase